MLCRNRLWLGFSPGALGDLTQLARWHASCLRVRRRLPLSASSHHCVLCFVEHVHPVFDGHNASRTRCGDPSWQLQEATSSKFEITVPSRKWSSRQGQALPAGSCKATTDAPHRRVIDSHSRWSKQATETYTAGTSSTADSNGHVLSQLISCSIQYLNCASSSCWEPLGLSCNCKACVASNLPEREPFTCSVPGLTYAIQQAERRSAFCATRQGVAVAMPEKLLLCILLHGLTEPAAG